jgi:hypothetical protein
MRYAAKKLSNIAKISSMVPKIVITSTYSFIDNAGKIITYTKTYKAVADTPLSVDEAVQDAIKEFAYGPVEFSLEVTSNSINDPNDFKM